MMIIKNVCMLTEGKKIDLVIFMWLKLQTGHIIFTDNI